MLGRTSPVDYMEELLRAESSQELTCFQSRKRRHVEAWDANPRYMAISNFESRASDGRYDSGWTGHIRPNHTHAAASRLIRVRKPGHLGLASPG